MSRPDIRHLIQGGQLCWDLSQWLRYQSDSKHCLHRARQWKCEWLPLCSLRIHFSWDYAWATLAHLPLWVLNLMQPLWEPLELLVIWIRNKYRSCILKWPLQKLLTAKETAGGIFAISNPSGETAVDVLMETLSSPPSVLGSFLRKLQQHNKLVKDNSQECQPRNRWQKAL